MFFANLVTGGWLLSPFCKF